MARVEVYDEKNIDTIQWPDTADGRYAKHYLVPFIKNGPQKYVSNAVTKMKILKIDEIILPITINEKEYSNNCYLCSLIAQYVDYSKKKLNVKNPLIRLWLGFLKRLMLFGSADKTIHVNNWLMSTNLYPKMNLDQLLSVRDFLTDSYPSYTIIFRSINEKQDPEIYESLKANHFLFLASRPVFMTCTKKNKIDKSRMFKSDLKMLENTDYEVIDNGQIPLSESKRIADLYAQLNIEKYSPLNPIYSKEFIELAIRKNLLHFKALMKDGKIDGIMGYFERNQVITSPLFGYDTSKPQEIGLYRKISALLSLEALQKKYLLNGSGGAASYKKLRRAEGVIEYHGIYCNHLSARQRMPWKFLYYIMKKWGIPFIRKYEL